MNETEKKMRKLALPDEVLLSVQKPARYLGNEANAVYKDRAQVDIRFAMCFPGECAQAFTFCSLILY